LGGNEEDIRHRAKTIAVALGIVFAVLTTTLAVSALVAEGTYTPSMLEVRLPISIEGDADFGTDNGVTGGTGTAIDPFVIEGWSITTNKSHCISVNNTDAYILIRNVSLSFRGETNLYTPRGAGISLNNASNVKIESCFFQSFPDAIRSNGTPDDVNSTLKISKCTFMYGYYAISVRNTTSCMVTDCWAAYVGGTRGVVWISNCTMVLCSRNDLESAGSMAISVDNCTDCALRDNDLSASGGYGFWIADTDGADIANNSISSFEQGIAAHRCPGVTISHNDLSRGRGIWVNETTGASVHDNTLHLESYGWIFAHISMTNCEDSVVSNNVIRRSGGIAVSDCRNCVVSGNHVSEAGYYRTDGAVGNTVLGMWTHGSTNLTISGNVFVNSSGPGLEVSGVGITVVGNEISCNSWKKDPYWYSAAGLYASGSDLSIRYNRIFGNTIRWTMSTPGVMLESCDNSTFECNNVSDEIELWYCDNLTVESNSFSSGWNLTAYFSTGGVVVAQNNFPEDISIKMWGDAAAIVWDSGYPDGGNYWPSYSGDDQYEGPLQDVTGPDGFGDTPYLVTGTEEDAYPRMLPYNCPDNVAPTTVALVNGSRGDRTWFVSVVNVSLQAFDSNDSSPGITWSLDSGPWEAYRSTILVSEDGDHELRFRSDDNKNNLEQTKSVKIRIDTQAPSFAAPLEREYRFRLKSSETVYIPVALDDQLSGVSQVQGSYIEVLYGWYSNTRTQHGAWSWLPLTPQSGEYDLTITVIDGAGNSFDQTVGLSASVAPNVNPLSPEGPYKGWFILGILADLVVAVAALEMLVISHGGWMRESKWTPREEGERHYDEDVVDGYPKYSRKI
jgi:parallel beta-helix repeat protein